ncbi:hypothetical protein Dvina_45430 [Dactylosporangium vinaceum]|uniref:Uncharacterized protein n=1 Tax=Dactylosporangium vinaceum TaxID=53362 RepID=A0ABV5LZ67_9ACTN|nr:hypothetical protein [Dactylosporangium vinaceum]UAB95212.1 hypothetical protein Dvina_45430 [Dactylosporangium vinaceum]
MTTPADLAHEVLLRVAAFVKSLPADQLADLASGEAKLELVPKAGRSPRPPRRPAAAGAALSRPVTEIQDMLSQLETRQAATQYLNDLKLTVPQLKELAKVLGIPAPAKSTKTTLTTTIVDTTTGRRADSLALSAP